jgi:hypothetical protein
MMTDGKEKIYKEVVDDYIIGNVPEFVCDN